MLSCLLTYCVVMPLGQASVSPSFPSLFSVAFCLLVSFMPRCMLRCLIENSRPSARKPYCTSPREIFSSRPGKCACTRGTPWLRLWAGLSGCLQSLHAVLIRYLEPNQYTNVSPIIKVRKRVRDCNRVGGGRQCRRADAGMAVGKSAVTD